MDVSNINQRGGTAGLVLSVEIAAPKVCCNQKTTDGAVAYGNPRHCFNLILGRILFRLGMFVLGEQADGRGQKSPGANTFADNGTKMKSAHELLRMGIQSC